MNTPALAARNWIDPFDRWHLLLLPPALIIVGILLVVLPKPPPTPASGPHRFHPGTAGDSARLPIPAPLTPPSQSSPAPAQSAPPAIVHSQAQRLQPPVPAPMRPTRIESPSPNALFWRDRLGDVEGTAEPGSTVQLVLGQKLLAQTTADADGRYRFRLAGFPPGTHRLQVVAVAGPNRQSIDSVGFTVKGEASPKAKAQPQPQTKTPIKEPSSKTGPAKAAPTKAKPAATKPAGKPGTKPKSAPQSTNSPAKPHKKPAATRPAP